MRSVFSVLAGLVAVLAFAVALPLGWVATHVADEDGYVRFTTGLVDDPQFRVGVVKAVTDDVVDRAGVSETFAPAIRSAIEAAASKVVDTEQFRTAFEQTQRQSHQAVFDGGRGSSDRFVIDLAPVAKTIIDSVTGNLPVAVEAPERLLVTIGDSDQRSTIEMIDQAPQRATLLGGTAAVAAVLSLLAARRRSVALLWLGVGAAAVAAGTWVLADRVVPAALAQVESGNALANRAQQLLADAALASFDRWVVVAVIAAGGAAVLGLLTRATSSLRR